MTVTISALFDDYARASEAVKNLELAGLPSDDISIVANNTDGQYDPARPHISRVVGHDRDRDGVDDRVEGAEAGAGIGAAVGGVAGLLAGLGLLAVPGLGPVVAAGWLASRQQFRGRGRRRRDHRCAQPIGRHRRRRSSLCGGDWRGGTLVSAASQRPNADATRQSFTAWRSRSVSVKLIIAAPAGRGMTLPLRHTRPRKFVASASVSGPAFDAGKGFHVE